MTATGQSRAVSDPAKRRLLIRPSRGWWTVGWEELWRYREVLYYLVWRDLKVRYKQSALGALWILLQPLGSMLVFTAVFHYALRIEAGESVPYYLFAYAALVPWFYFSSSLIRCADSMVANANLVSKIYFPRLFIPIAASLGGLIDLTIGLMLLLGLVVTSGIVPGAALLALPIVVASLVGTTLGIGLWLAALNVRYRDVRHVAPFVVQTWMYVTPVIYALTAIPERWRWLVQLNPLTNIIEQFRASALGAAIDLVALTLSLGIATLFLVLGLLYFQYTEHDLADVI